MPFQPVPYAPPRLYEPRYGDSIADLLMRRGDIEAQRAAQSGALWGQALANIGGAVAGAVQQRREQKTEERRQRGISEALNAWDGQDVRALYRAVAPFAGAEGALKLAQGVVAFRELGEKQDEREQERLGISLGAAELLPDEDLAKVYPVLRQKAAVIGMPVDEWPEQYSPELKPAMTRYGQLLRGEKPTEGPKTPQQIFEESKARAAGERAGAPPVPPKPEKTLAEIEAEAEARARGGRRGAPPEAAGPRPLTETAEANIINRLATQFTKAVAPLRDLGRQAALMDKGIEAAERGDLAAGSQAVLVTFQKILDPTSVVRESEYARSAAGQSLVARARGAVERLAKGGAGVPVSELRKFARLAHEMMEGTATAGLKATTERIGKTADRYNIPRELVLEEVNLGSQPEVPVAGVKIKSITPIP